MGLMGDICSTGQRIEHPESLEEANIRKNLSDRAKSVEQKLAKERRLGSLKKGTVASIIVSDRPGTYVGEVNAEGYAHGFGTFTCADNEVKGIFYNNKAHGFCTKVQPSGSIAMGEM